MLRHLLICLLVWHTACPLFGQLNCGHATFLKNALQDSAFASEHERSEAEAVRYFQKIPAAARPEKGVAMLTIPVVVHILHQNGPENIPDAQVQQAVQWLNDAFANAGPYKDGNGNNTEIRFCLATRDPDGQRTMGILRIESPQTSLDLRQDGIAKSQSYWRASDYLNIWVVKEICWESLGCNVAAYASGPGFHGSNLDGIVIEDSFFGTTPERTVALAHEAGHYP